MMINIFFSVCFLIAFFKLYKKTSGTLSLNYLNASSLAFYYILVFQVVGTILIYIGFRNHYGIAMIRSDVTFKSAFFITVYSCLIMPLITYLFQKMCKVNVTEKSIRVYSNMTCSKIHPSRDLSLIVIIMIFLSIFAAFYTFYYIGYVPLLKTVTGNFNFATERIVITRSFGGNQYIKNILFLNFAPILSFITYCYYRLNRTTKWRVLFYIMFMLSVLAKTYNFEKAPIILYVATFYVIELMLGVSSEWKKNKRKNILIIFTISTVIFLYVFVMDYSDGLLNLSHGPLSRIFISGASCLYLHVDCFPKYSPFLHGASLPVWMGTIIGNSNFGQRSGRVVAWIYERVGVELGVTGVANAFFPGEAYANWGIIGVIVAPVIVGIIYGILQVYILKRKKTPMRIVMYVVLAFTFMNALMGGFVDFLYNLVTLINIMFFVFLINLEREI